MDMFLSACRHTLVPTIISRYPTMVLRNFIGAPASACIPVVVMEYRGHKLSVVGVGIHVDAP